MAAIGCSRGQKHDALEALRGKDVIVYPNRDAISSWSAKKPTFQSYKTHLSLLRNLPFRAMKPIVYRHKIWVVRKVDIGE